MNIMVKKEVIEKCPDRRSKTKPTKHFMRLSVDKVFATYNGSAINPIPRSVMVRLPRSIFDGGAIEDVLQMASNIRMFPRTAGIADKTLITAVQTSRNEISDCTNLYAQKNQGQIAKRLKCLPSMRKRSPLNN